LALDRIILLNSDTNLKEENGILYIGLALGSECYALAPKAVEIPKTGQ
jgi:hypothetical protein